jgi:hypothetical protein
MTATDEANEVLAELREKHSGRGLLFRTMYAAKYDAPPLHLRSYRYRFRFEGTAAWD